MTVPKSLQPWAAELLGTYGFVTIGAAAGIMTGAQLGNSGLLGVAIGNGLGLGVMIATFAAISGSHFNPAVTLSALVGRKISSADALGYAACQILGALGAGVTVRTIFAESVWRPAHLGAPTLTVGVGKGVLIEAVFTFFLAMVIWGTGIDERAPKVGGLFIGLTVVVGVLAVGPFTGGAFNPARYIGPAAVSGDVTHWWVYFVGPGIGGAIAGLVYPTIFQGGFPWARPSQAEPAPAAGRTASRRSAP